MNIRDEIRRLATKWIGPEYAARFDASHVLKDLLAYAFMQGIERHSDDGMLLLEAHRRLQEGALTGDYQKGDYFAPCKFCDVRSASSATYAGAKDSRANARHVLTRELGQNWPRRERGSHD